MQDCNRIGCLDREGSDATRISRATCIATAAGHDHHTNCIFVTNNYFLCYYVDMILILALGRTWTASTGKGRRRHAAASASWCPRPPLHDRSASTQPAPPPPMTVIRRAARWAVSSEHAENGSRRRRWEWININEKKIDLRFVQGCLGSCVQGAFRLGEQRTGRAICPATCFALFSIPFLFSSCCSCFRPFSPLVVLCFLRLIYMPALLS